MVLRRHESGEIPSDIEALLEAERRRVAGLGDGENGEAPEGNDGDHDR